MSVTPKELAIWASANGVDLRAPGDKLALVNAKRAALWLPPFRVIHPPVEQIYAAPKVPVIAATEAQFVDTIRSFVGTRTGLMTPECAGWALARARNERPPERQAVSRFAAIIKAGEWKNTAEPLIFARDEKLNDGRARLAAIAETGIAVELDVRFGVDPAAYEVTNSGAPRKAADTLHIMGAEHSSAQAGLARLLYLHDHGQLGVKGARKVEIPLLVNLIEETPAIPLIAAFMAAERFAPAKMASFGMVLVAAARVSSVEKALEFGKLVAEGRDDDQTPTRSLHVRLRDLRMSAGRKMNPVEIAIMTAKGWNGWVTGKSFSLRVTAADLASGGFPIIKAPVR